MKYLWIICAIVLITGCVSEQTNKHEESVFDLIQSRAEKRYSIWRERSEISENEILFYGDEGNYRTITNQNNGPSLASGWHQMIYYRNKTDKQNLTAVTIMGMFNGDPRQNWYFTVENMNEDVLYQSPEFTFDVFPQDRMQEERFETQATTIPDEFIIKVTSHSNPENSLFIMLLEDHKHVFSFEYKEPFTYKELNDKNYCIFPEFR